LMEMRRNIVNGKTQRKDDN